MKKIPVYLSIGFPSARRESVVEVEDDATEDDINDAIRNWAMWYIDYGRSEDDED